MAGAATVEKALDVLFHLHEAIGPLGLTEIGRDLDLPKSSCHRLLSSLVDREVVERDERGRYRPGLALLALGLGAQAHEPVVRAARPALELEAGALGETVFLVALRRDTLRVLDKCEGSGFLRASPEIGDRVPSDVTASGILYRVLGDRGLATADDAEAVPASSTVIEAQQVQERGYATNRDAWIEGLSVLAVPIWQSRIDGGRNLVATLALGAASVRFDTLGEEEIAQRLLDAARGIEQRLGHRAAGPRAGRQRARTAPNTTQEARS